MNTEAAIARDFDLIVTKFGVWSLETIDAAEVRNETAESRDVVLGRLQSILGTGKSWRNEIKPDAAAGAFSFGTVASDF